MTAKLSTRPGIATAVPSKPNKYRIRILFDDSSFPVDMMGAFATKVEAFQSMRFKFVNLRVVNPQEFLCELDHIKLFKCRSTVEDVIPTQPNTEYVDSLEQIDMQLITLFDQTEQLKQLYKAPPTNFDD